ncbi:MAG: hypothetical protein A07HB70_01281 [uncultured archaeon A07HB70]|nr:MAG: hypothetical protein A07HB70_01281 [uncultured archaeon A07HB70]
MFPIPLQLPGGVELLIVFLIGLFFLVVSVVVSAGAAYWVYRDATRRGRDDATLWAVATLGGFLVAGVGGIAVLVVYLLVREDGPGRHGAP